MRIRTIVFLIVIVAIAAAGIYGWREYHRTHKSLLQEKAAFEVKADALISEFATDTAAERKYLGKVIAVTGEVGHVETDSRGDFTVVLGAGEAMSGVRCAMDTTQRTEAARIQKGQSVTLKGLCTGYQEDVTGLLGSDVLLNRCVIAGQ